MTHDVYRPAAKARITALPGDDGVPRALSIVAAAPSPTRSIAARLMPSAPVAGPDRFLAEGLFDTPYALPVYHSETVDADAGVPVGFWRSVGYAHNTFFLECALDEIAVRSSADPLTQRLALLERDVRARGVLVRATERAGWKEPKEGIARGLAFCRAYGSDVACVAEVSGTLDALTIERLVLVADVGIALDPSLVTDQLVSGAVFGLGAAMHQAVSFSDGVPNETNFDTFELLRLSGCPVIDTEVLQTGDTPGGVGELAVPVIAPALANAIFALTGERIRSLPLIGRVTFA
jgi:isoquinoline 1-oxidoreductase beta subunit